MTKKAISTFEREMKNSNLCKSFIVGYKVFLLSELIIAVMESDQKSVRSLAKEIGLSPTVIQKIRSSKQDNIKISNFVGIVQACGYKVILEKGKERIFVENDKNNYSHQLKFVYAR